jgi:hypothetical protein
MHIRGKPELERSIQIFINARGLPFHIVGSARRGADSPLRFCAQNATSKKFKAFDDHLTARTTSRDLFSQTKIRVFCFEI